MKSYNNNDLHREHIKAGPVSRWQAVRALVDRALADQTMLYLEQKVHLMEARIKNGISP